MTSSYTQDFLRGSGRQQSRVLLALGSGLVAVLTLTAVVLQTLYPRLTEPAGIGVALDLPYVGPGVESGTKVMLHGATVGSVTEVDSATPGTVSVQLDLEPGDVRGLTDTFDVDFGPRNYFGTTGINIIPGEGGNQLVDGSVIRRTPIGDFTMATMIEHGSYTVEGTLAQDLVHVLDKMNRYTTAVTPLIETSVTVADRIAATQRNLPSELLVKFDDILAEMPEFNRELIDMLFAVYRNESYNVRADGSFGTDLELMDMTNRGLDLSSSQLFTLAGRLLASHQSELLPLTQILTEASDLVPHFLVDGVSPSRLSTVIEQYESAFASNGSQKVLNVDIVMNSFPFLAAPLSMTDGETP